MQAKLTGETIDWDLVIVDEALQARPAGRPPHAASPSPHGDASQREGGGLPAFHGASRRRPVRGPLPRWGPRRRPVGSHSAAHQGTAPQVRRDPLFPERWAYTANYRLSDLEAQLYREVTEYVREGMNRAERLAQEGEGRRGNLVGWALTILQRRLAAQESGQ
jgi:hypothetical protein